MVVRVPMSEQWGDQLPEEICLTICRETDSAEMSGLEASAEEPVRCSCDLKVAIGVDGGSVRQLDGIEDAFAPQSLELFGTET